MCYTLNRLKRAIRPISVRKVRVTMVNTVVRRFQWGEPYLLSLQDAHASLLHQVPQLLCWWWTQNVPVKVWALGHPGCGGKLFNANLEGRARGKIYIFTHMWNTWPYGWADTSHMSGNTRHNVRDTTSFSATKCSLVGFGYILNNLSNKKTTKHSTPYKEV